MTETARSLSDIYGSQQEKNPREELISYLVTKVSEIADLDKEIIKANIKALNAADDIDRRVFINRCSFILTYFAPFMRELVYNPQFRGMFVGSVTLELSMHMKSEEEILKIREELLVNRKDAPTDYYIIYGKQKFSDDVYEGMLDVVKASYSLLGTEQLTLIKDGQNQPDEQRRILGIAFSNFGFILRMIALNDKYMMYLADCARQIDAHVAQMKKEEK